MSRRFSTSVLALALLVTAMGGASSAQTDISVTPIANVPFSGVVRVERTMIRRNGSVNSLKNTRDISRDSHGRVYEALRWPAPVSKPDNACVVRIHLYDPQTTIATTLDTKSHTFVQETVEHPPSTLPRMPVYASSKNDGVPNDFMKEEDLGTSEIAGIPVHGVRDLQITPAANSKTGSEIVISDEYWYAADLQIYLMVKHSDPRTGTVTLTVGEITRAEPDPATFEIPTGYKPKY